MATGGDQKKMLIRLHRRGSPFEQFRCHWRCLAASASSQTWLLSVWRRDEWTPVPVSYIWHSVLASLLSTHYGWRSCGRTRAGQGDGSL